jgi:hypothetical protein
MFWQPFEINSTDAPSKHQHIFNCFVKNLPTLHCQEAVVRKLATCPLYKRKNDKVLQPSYLAQSLIVTPTVFAVIAASATETDRTRKILPWWLAKEPDTLFTPKQENCMSE